MRLRSGLAALLGVLALAVFTGCGISIRAVDDTTAVSTPATSRASVPTPTARSASDPSQTRAATPSPTLIVPTKTAPSPEPTPTVAPTVPPTPTPRPASPQQVAPPPAQVQPPAPTPTPMPPTPTPAPTPTPTAPTCADLPVRGFGLLWNSQPTVARTVGCPLAPEIGLSARIQRFHNGVMVWLDTLTPGIDQAPWVITLIGDAAARYRVPANGPAWDDDLSEPTGAFKWVWDNVYSVQASIGAAQAAWYATDAAIQRFDHGTMLWLRQPPQGERPMIYVFPGDLLNASMTTYHSYIDQGAP